MPLAETLSLALVAAVIAALMAGYPVALTLAGVSLAFAITGHNDVFRTGAFDQGFRLCFGPNDLAFVPAGNLFKQAGHIQRNSHRAAWCIPQRHIYQGGTGGNILQQIPPVIHQI